MYNNIKVHHHGVVVKNILKSIDLYSKLGYKQKTEIIIDLVQNIKICFVEKDDSSQLLELLESINETSSISNFKVGYHHICYDVGEISSFIDTFKEHKIGKIFTKPLPAVAIENRNVVFACLNNGLFVEFIL